MIAFLLLRCYSFDLFPSKQDRKCTCNVTLRHVLATIVVMEKQ